jgi:hypothetical protein
VPTRQVKKPGRTIKKPSTRTARRTAAAIASVSASSATDSALRIGALLLVALVIADTILLTLSTRFLRQS